MAQAIAEEMVETTVEPAKAKVEKPAQPMILVEVTWTGQRGEMFDAEPRMVTAAIKDRFEPGFLKSITPPMPRQEDYMPDDQYQKLVDEWSKAKPKDGELHVMKAHHGSTDLDQGFYVLRGEDVLTRPVLHRAVGPTMKLSHDVKIMNPAGRPFFTLADAKAYMASIVQ